MALDHITKPCYIIYIPLKNESKRSYDNCGDDMTVGSKDPMVHAML